MKESVIRVFKSFYRYLFFFLLVAFLITCCIMLFTQTIMNTTGIEFTADDISIAAKLTFVNVLFFSLALTVANSLQRKFIFNRHVKKIKEAAEKITAGNFSVRIKPSLALEGDAYYNEIIACFNKMAEELSGIETLRGDFISNVSHEMKTPLAVIQNYGALLQAEDLPPEERIEYAKGIAANTRRLSEMITNILKLNRLENQTIYRSKTSFNLGEAVCEDLLRFESVWEQKNISIETDIAEDVMVFEDGELLSLVWNNLLSNAFKFTKEGGAVGVTVKEEGSYAVLSISDTGIGIDPAVGKRIFEKFYQADTSHATLGNGLGLALVKRIIDIIGGDISVCSELGRGSEFTVKIPIEKAMQE